MDRRLLAFALFACAPLAAAQLSPERTYNGVDRPFPVRVRIPSGMSGAAEIRLLSPPAADPLARATVKAGRVDLARALPDLWKAKAARVLYAQLFVGNKPVGPALVLQPLTNPPLARLKGTGATATVEFEADEDKAYSGIRTWIDKHVVLDTTLGTMEFRMRPDAAPNTVWNFLELVRGGFYTDIPWHRVVARRRDGTPFVIQAGDPTGTGSGGPGYSFPLEPSRLPHDFGVLSMARSTDPNTNGSQFFVCLSREGTKHLDGRYAAFGEAVRGSRVILSTAAVKVGENDRPLTLPRIRTARLIDAPPYGTGPRPLRRAP